MVRAEALRRLKPVLLCVVALSITTGLLRGGGHPPLLISASENVSGEFPGIPALQSFAAASYKGKWILIGGRTNGYHATGGKSSDFARTEANRDIWVIDTLAEPTKRVFHRPVATLPANLRKVADQWMATSLLSCQDGDTLYVAGGYGENSDHQWVTYSLLSAVNIPALISSVVAGEDSFSKTITFVETPIVQSTGGRLLKLSDGFVYLVMGHVFMGRYGDYEGNGETNHPAVWQKYLGEIRKLKISNRDGVLSVNQIAVFSDPEYLRRDLNVEYTVLSDGKTIGGAAYGGVFTKEQLAFSKPVYFGPDRAPWTDQSFEQKMNAYASATMLIFDSQVKTMYTTFFGGISRWIWNRERSRLELAPKVGDKTTEVYLDGMEWTNQISTVMHNGPTTTEFVQEGERLPGYLGTSATFFPITSAQSDLAEKGVLDMSNFRGRRSLAGYMYGGIEAFPKVFPYLESSKTQRPGAVPTKPSNVVLKVYVTAQ